MTEQYNHDIEARSVEVYVVTHKEINFALPDYCRKIQVNAERNGQWENYLHDNDNPDNISLKNPDYCELTALYSMWKNCEADIQGLMHYRRFLSTQTRPLSKETPMYAISENEVINNAITRQRIIDELKTSDIIRVTPAESEYLNIGEIFSMYCKRENIRDVGEIIRKYYPDYLQAFLDVVNGNKFSQGNIFIANRSFVNNYCEWLFGILAKTEEFDRVMPPRFQGYLSEFLINVYIHKHNFSCKYFCLAYVKNESPKIRLLRKIPGLVKFSRSLNKFLHRPTSSKRKFGQVPAIIQKQNISSNNVGILTFTTETINNNLLPKLKESMNEAEAWALQEGIRLMPRIILSKNESENISEPLNLYLWEACIRIMND